MSRSYQGFKVGKGPRGSYRVFKKETQAKMRARTRALCDAALRGDDVPLSEFPTRIECFDWWSVD